MEQIKKILKLIGKHKEWIFNGIGVTILTSLLFHNNGNQPDIYNENKEYNISQNVEINHEYQNNISSESDTEKKYEQEIIMSESNYLEYLKDNVEGEVLFYYYNDYDGDGTCEMFALVGEAIDGDGLYEEDNLSGEIWYVNQNGVMRIENNEIIYWSSPYTFSIGVNAFIAFEKYYATGSLTYIWGVKNGKPYQPNISGKGNGLRINEYNEIEITDSAYDMVFDKSMNLMIGHTWKKYYFYFDGNTFREYGGISIKVEDILDIPGGEAIVDEIYNNSSVIESIYYRENGIININISKESDEEIRYYNITLRYDGKESYFVPSMFEDNYSEGIYLRAFIPSVAIYPDEYPY